MKRAKIATRPVTTSRRFSTGLIEWIPVSEDRPAFHRFNIVQVGRVPSGPSYVIRFVGEPPNRMLYLFRNYNDAADAYLEAKPERSIRMLHDAAEAHARDEQGSLPRRQIKPR